MEGGGPNRPPISATAGGEEGEKKGATATTTMMMMDFVVDGSSSMINNENIEPKPIPAIANAGSPTSLASTCSNDGHEDGRFAMGNPSSSTHPPTSATAAPSSTTTTTTATKAGEGGASKSSTIDTTNTTSIVTGTSTSTDRYEYGNIELIEQYIQRENIDPEEKPYQARERIKRIRLPVREGMEELSEDEGDWSEWNVPDPEAEADPEAKDKHPPGYDGPRRKRNPENDGKPHRIKPSYYYPTEGSSRGVPVFEPSMEEFRDFNS